MSYSVIFLTSLKSIFKIMILFIDCTIVLFSVKRNEFFLSTGVTMKKSELIVYIPTEKYLTQQSDDYKLLGF